MFLNGLLLIIQIQSSPASTPVPAYFLSQPYLSIGKKISYNLLHILSDTGFKIILFKTFFQVFITPKITEKKITLIELITTSAKKNPQMILTEGEHCRESVWLSLLRTRRTGALCCLVTGTKYIICILQDIPL